MNWKIVMFPKIQVDTAISFFLLKNFGERKFPGIAKATVEFWSELPTDRSTEDLELDGYILIDLGNGKFDHHRLGPENKKFSSSHLVAQHLEIDDRQDLQRLLEFARRDDLEGHGTLSPDPIDRAFGFAGLLMTLNKSIPNSPKQILDIVTPLLAGHFIEENRRFEQLPAEHQKLVTAGRVKEFAAIQLGKQLKIVWIESDNPALAGYLRSRAVGADLVIQKATTGHVNFITKQARMLYLHKLARLVKLMEAQKHGITLNVDSALELERPGRTEGLPHWYYDTRANTLQNGGVQPQGIPPTRLLYEEIEDLVKQGLNVERESLERHVARRDDRGEGPRGPRQNFRGRRDDRRDFGDRRRGDPRDRYDRNRGVVIIE